MSLGKGARGLETVGWGELAHERVLPSRQQRLVTKLLLTALFVMAVVPTSFAVEKSRSASAPAATENQRVPPSREVGCNKKMSRANRLAVLDDLTTRLEAELTRSPSILTDDALRDRAGTFIAGSMHDDVPFVSLDRWCWVDFYEAHRSLAKGNDSAAFQSASHWKVCLAATFRDRMELARPYLGCFPRAPKP